MTEYRFVLVHGSWHDGSAWKPVADRLDVAGHHVTAPTVAGHGKDADKDISHEDCVRSIVDHIVDGGFEDVVLVGHSFGGTVIARVACEIPERLHRLVFWNAFVPEDGNCLNDETPPHYRQLFDSLAEVDLGAFYASQIPRSYLNCTEDIALPPGEWGWHPRMSNRLGLYRLVQMPGSHEALFTNPQ
ncbi:MAG TPA: alpha/beta hydrolase, partial [Solirubrobacter sp.]|nr:alpha/beta hydrolase [Solirubrobacter sp.]